MRHINEKLLDKVESYFNANNWIIKDGIVNEHTFEESPIKILWILREMNEVEDMQNLGGDMRQDWRACVAQNNLNPYHSPQGGYSRTYALIIKVSRAILENEWEPVPYQKVCQQVLPQIAIINAKKLAGGARINPFAMEHHYRNDADLLKDQIEGINPDIILNTNHLPELWNHLNVENPPRVVSCSDVNPKRKGEFYSYRQKETGRIVLGVQHTNTRHLTHAEYIKLVHLCLAEQNFRFS